jgi:hypothetical protein
VQKNKFTLIAIVAIAMLAGTSIGAAAQDGAEDPTAPAYFTGTSGEPAQVVEGEVTETETGNSMTGFQFLGIPFEATDPRISGTLDIAANGSGQGVPEGFARLESRTYRIVNDAGSWSGTGSNLFALQRDEPAIDVETFLLSGEGAYEGLSAYIVIDFMGEPLVRGVILSQELATFPAQ